MKKLLFIATVVFASMYARANNIQITNVSVMPANKTIKFDVSWDNSWRSNTLNNWDAAWVFFKYYNLNSIPNNWSGISLTNLGNIAPVGFNIDGLEAGVFIHRSASGSGTVSLTNVEVGVPDEIASGIFDIRAYAIEMVYIPGGMTRIGDVFSTNCISLNPSVFPYSTTVSTINANFFDPLTTPGNAGFSALFPNGVTPFYCMKYELSQGGYRDFLNSLNYAAQASHVITAPNTLSGAYAFVNANRNYLKIKQSGVSSTTPAIFGCDADNDGIYDESTDGESVACNYLNWIDHSAYLCWAGLRPLTELEFEKAARGIQFPVAGEYAWGNTQIANLIYSLTGSSSNAEIVSNPAISPIGNANYGISYPNFPLNGPLRNGIFATATSDRISSGGSFYGVMELSGNLWERVITTANTSGRSFNGSEPPFGSLSGNGFVYWGNSFLTTWPGINAGIIDGTANATGLIYRGGSWSGGVSARLRISDRGGLVVVDANTVRSNDVGVRGGRTAP
jgi:formylglycine-generating enzyme required for sulfatase activity